MNVQDRFLKQRLDTSNFVGLRANAGVPVSNEAELKSASEVALRAQIDQLKKYAKSDPDGVLVDANRNILQAEGANETWMAGPGDFSITSLYAWALGGGVMFPGEAPLGFLFGGKGESWRAWATGTIVILGSFVVDPQQIVRSSEFHEEDSPIGRVRKGLCNFTASGGGAGISGVTISFYSLSGTFWGTLNGTGALVGGFSLEGQLELVWQGWR
jgi:hypothetical protein